MAGSAIEVTGNTVNDVLKHHYVEEKPNPRNLVLLSLHRRANQGARLHQLLEQVAQITKAYPNLKFTWLMHPTPKVRAAVSKYTDCLQLLPNLPYPEVVKLYSQCRLVITDSGGIMEETAFLGIPRIIIRTHNERIGLLQAKDTFVYHPRHGNLSRIFDQALRTEGAKSKVYGEGDASIKIVDALIGRNVLQVPDRVASKETVKLVS